VVVIVLVVVLRSGPHTCVVRRGIRKYWMRLKKEVKNQESRSVLQRAIREDCNSSKESFCSGWYQALL
jgi:hypothetical protein